VRRIHRTLRGTDPRTGVRFRIDEPQLLLWVHCAETWSFLTVLRRAGFPLTDAQADRYLAEQARDRDPGRPAGRRGARLAGRDDPVLADIRPELAPHGRVRRHLPLPAPATGAGGAAAGTARVHRVDRSPGVLAAPGWAQRLHGRTAYPGQAATLLLRTFRFAALGVPTRLRWGKPEPYALEAIERLGPSAIPSVRRLPAC